jgi:hypothetical protein
MVYWSFPRVAFLVPCGCAGDARHDAWVTRLHAPWARWGSWDWGARGSARSTAEHAELAEGRGTDLSFRPAPGTIMALRAKRWNRLCRYLGRRCEAQVGETVTTPHEAWERRARRWRRHGTSAFIRSLISLPRYAEDGQDPVYLSARRTDGLAWHRVRVSIGKEAHAPVEMGHTAWAGMRHSRSSRFPFLARVRSPCTCQDQARSREALGSGESAWPVEWRMTLRASALRRVRNWDKSP